MKEDIFLKDFKEITSKHRVFLCPTDTIYGLSARINDKEAINRIHKLKGGKSKRKGFVVLVSSISQIEKHFKLKLAPQHKKLLQKLWPGPYSVILPNIEGFAFRMPDYPELLAFLKRTGPIISTSANKHGKTPATSAKQAYKIFGEQIDAYIDKGSLRGKPSTLIEILR